MRNLTNTGFFISSKIGKAIKDYNLIEDGDKILIAVSGGKDSLTLLKLLHERKRWAPVKFDIIAAHIETDFKCAGCAHRNVLSGTFKDMGAKYLFKKIKILDKDKNTSCFWCSWNRRKALFKMADKNGCNKVAFGHHKDDIIETTLLNLFFQGEFSTMNPRQELFNGGMTVIRPLCYVEERMIKKFAKENGFPKQLCRCPNSYDSNRRYLKGFIKRMEKRSPHIRTNIFRSVARIKREYIDLKEEK
ncbi:MAG: ATP-binding protein [Candidatus Omnitrophota bacterium]